MAVAAGLLLAGAAPTMGATRGSKVPDGDAVLVLNSYHQGMDWTDGEISGLREELDKSSRAELYIEHMDAKRMMDPIHFRNIYELLAHKYRSIKLDAIVTTDNDAFDFMRRHRDKLFPGVPVVFCGVNRFHGEQLHGLAGFTGVAETTDHAATLDLMLQLHPETERIVAIVDSTTTGKVIQQELAAAVAPALNGRLRFEVWNPDSRDDLTKRLAVLPPKSLVWLMPYTVDQEGKFSTSAEIADLVSAYSRAPVYANWDVYLGHGVVGGAMTSAKTHGRAAGEALMRVLAGTSAEAIPVRLQTPSYYAFDYRQLTRFDIPPSALPEYSTIVNKPWHVTYRWLIWSGGVFALAFVLLVAALWSNITRRRKADQELRIAAKAFDLQVGMVVTDHEATILRVNDAFTRVTGYAAAEVVGRKPSILRSGRHDEAFYRNLWGHLAEHHDWQGVVWNRRKSGSIYAEWLTIRAVLSPKGVVTQYVGSFTDITLNHEAEAEVHRLAYYDQLTGFPNRRLLNDRLGQAISLSQTTRSIGALFVIDLDNFSAINSTRGYAAGDAVLIAAGQRIRCSQRESDTVARLGGDEFAVIAEDLGDDPEGAAPRARNMAQALSDALGEPYELGEMRVALSASIGITLFHRGEPVEQLLANCEIALNKARASGRRTLCFFDPAMQAAIDQRSAMEQALRVAVEERTLIPYYQAQTDYAGRVLGAELLLRWKHGERGFIPPSEFIPVAEEAGLIEIIGEQVLESACRQIRSWSDRAETAGLRLSVNVSARQFQQDDFVASIERILTRSGAAPGQLMLELTETIVLADVDSALQKMHALKRLGLAFSMDDFGTGYSSLAYLTQLPLDELKIDRSFVSRLPGSHNDGVIAQTVISMGHSLGLEVLAEGVETAEQRDTLHGYGCHAYQGYLVGKPMPVEDFTRWLCGG